LNTKKKLKGSRSFIASSAFNSFINLGISDGLEHVMRMSSTYIKLYIVNAGVLRINNDVSNKEPWKPKVICFVLSLEKQALGLVLIYIRLFGACKHD
jgi:hypothetical protein